MSTTGNALTEVSCPECGTVTAVSVTGRTASDFCPSCDYPLFWAGSGGAAVSEAGSAADALRRAPGTSGSVTSSSLTCPECGEKNPSTGVTCVRCGADLHPAPAPEPPPPSPPQPIVINPPAQIVQCSHWPTWAVATLSAVITATVVCLAFLLTN